MRNALHFLNLDDRWRRLVTFTSLPFYPREKWLCYALNRRLSRSQNQSAENRNEVLQLSIPQPSYYSNDEALALTVRLEKLEIIF